MAKSFFGGFKEHLKSDFGGRYLSAVLAECLREAPEVSQALFGRKFDAKTHDFVPEWAFNSSQKRRADVAVLSNDNGKPVALLEVKYNDHKLDRTEDQIKDYLALSKQYGNAPFTYLTKEVSKLEDKEVIGDAGHSCMTYGEFYSRLEKKADHPIVKLLRDFLREEGHVFDEIKEEDDVKALIIQACQFPERHGHKKSIEGFKRSPETLQKLLNRSAALGDYVYEYCNRIFGNRPFTRFFAVPYLKNIVNGSKDELWAIENKYVSGGELYIESRIKRAFNNHSLYLSVGECYGLDVGKEEKLSVHVYATLDCQPGGIFQELGKSRTGATADKVKVQLKKAIKDAASKALKCGEVPLEYKNEIRKIAESFKT